MGYYTTFILEDAQDGLDSVNAFNKINSAIAEVVQDFDTSCHGKWYSCERDLLVISARNPEIAFKISGSGEDADDTWWKDYLNGQVVDYWNKPKVGLRLSSKSLAALAKQRIRQKQ
jgi:hypothetical protein